jgi:hypothetical protein
MSSIIRQKANVATQPDKFPNPAAVIAPVHIAAF